MLSIVWFILRTRQNCIVLQIKFASVIFCSTQYSVAADIQLAIHYTANDHDRCKFASVKFCSISIQSSFIEFHVANSTQNSSDSMLSNFVRLCRVPAPSDDEDDDDDDPHTELTSVQTLTTALLLLLLDLCTQCSMHKF